MKLVIDADVGLDDAQAILMALAHKDVEVLCITAVVGNTEVDNVCQNVLRLLSVAGREDIPVHKGCSKPIIKHEGLVSDYHGDDGFGDYPFDNQMDLNLLQAEHAAIKLMRLSKEHEGELVLLCLGPLTNIAAVLQMDPDFGKRLKSCYVMGGNYHGFGNVLPHGEFNFTFDPIAAHVVLKDLECPITLVCWELCLDNLVSWDWRVNSLMAKDSRCVDLLRKIESALKPSEFYCFADQLAAGVLLYPEIVVASEERPCSVVTEGPTKGIVVIDRREMFSQTVTSWSRIKIVRKIDAKTFLSRMVQDIHSLP